MAEVLPGLSSVAEQELSRLFGRHLKVLDAGAKNGISFRLGSNHEKLCGLRTVVAVYLLHKLPHRRPKALLGDANWRAFSHDVRWVLARQAHRAPFKSFSISAAGKDSSILKRVAAGLGKDTGLSYVSEKGDLLLRLRKGLQERDCWEILIRLTAQPLSARSWRVAHMRGALNATIAAGMAMVSQPKPKDRVLNIMCGSGTLLIERAAVCGWSNAVGCDINGSVLAFCRRNIEAAGVKNIALQRADAASLPFASNAFDVVYADMPWGEFVGRREANKELYYAALVEICRVCAPAARCLLLTQDTKSMEQALQRYSGRIEVSTRLKIFQKGFNPTLYVLSRSPD